MAAKKYLVPIDMSLLEIRNLLLELIAGAPGGPVEAQIWYNSVTKRIQFRSDTTTFTVVTGGGDLAAGSVAISALVTNPLARANHTGTQLAATISDLAAVVQAYRLDQFAGPNAAVSWNSQRITNLLDPVNPQDAATMAYVDATAQGLDVKGSVRVATTVAGTFASSFENGDTVDGVVLATGNRILLKNQVAGAENGLYTVNASGAPTRTTDANTSAEVTAGMYTFVSEGTANAQRGFVLITADPIVLGTTALVFTQFSGAGLYTGTNGVSVTGSVIEFVPASGGGLITAVGGASVDTTVVARKYSVLLTASATSYTITHNLNTLNVIIQVYLVADGSEVQVDNVRATVNTATIIFAVAPAGNAYRVVVLG